MSHYVYAWECQNCGCSDNSYVDDKTGPEDARQDWCSNCEDEYSRASIIEHLAYDQWLEDDD